MKNSLKIASISMLLSLCLASAACDNKDAAKTEATTEVKVDETNKNAPAAATPATPAAPTAAEKPADATSTETTKSEEVKTETTKTK